jgi:type I restriction enzyme, R subunit
MDTNNFVVRPKRALVERYANAEAWTTLKKDDLHELATDLAGLPSTVESEDEEAKRFDLLMLNLQLAVLRHEPRFTKLKEQVIEIAGLLEEQAPIPMVKDQLVLLEELQSDEWWQDVTINMLEQVRKKLRLLVRFIERHKRHVLYTDFEDEIGDEREFVLLAVAPQQSMERFKAKALAFLRDLEDHMTIHRLRMNMPLTAMDLDELENMMIIHGIGNAEMIAKAKEENQGLGLFIRSLVGLDRIAAKTAFAGFLGGSTHTATQLEFVNMIVDHLTRHGVMGAALLYESPFTDIAPHGPDGLFLPEEVDALVDVLDEVRASAVAA